MDDLATRLVTRRRELGLRQADLADLAGVSERFVRELESGKGSVRLDKVVPVLDVLGCAGNSRRLRPREFGPEGRRRRARPQGRHTSGHAEEGRWRRRVQLPR